MKIKHKKMKKIVFMLAILIGTMASVNAQKFAYIDSDYVLLHMPEYAEAQGELNRFSSKWEREIEAKYTNIQKMEEAFAAEKILLPKEMKDKREADIKAKRQEAMDLQRRRFGVGGDLFQKREELIKPVQDKLFEAIQELCSVKGYMVIFDKSNKSNMLYTNDKYDVSDKVIKKMGYKPGETIESEGKDEGGGQSGGKGAAPTGGKTTPKGSGAKPSGTNRKGGTVKPR